MSVPAIDLFGRSWGPAGRRWGPGIDGTMLEMDVVSQSDDGRALLVGEVKWTEEENATPLAAALERKAKKLLLAKGKDVFAAVWLKSGPTTARGAKVITPSRVLRVLR